MNYQVINSNDELSALCQAWQNRTLLTLDTEFVRTRTYYPHLGLLQLSDNEDIVMVDPLNITQWQPFIALLSSQHIEKHLHACSEDIEVFYHHFSVYLKPILDSQIVASFLDNPLSSGYASLVQKYLGITLDKSETRTDWLARPLTDKQFRYAAEDVLYLPSLMDKLIEQVKQAGWLEAAYEDSQMVVERKRRLASADHAYLNIKNSWQLKGKSLNYLQRLAAWRLIYAREHDIAQNFVIHEDVLLNLARHQPTSLNELAKLGMKGKEIRLFGEQCLDMLRQPIVTILPAIKRVVDYDNYKQLNKHIKSIAQEIAAQTGLAQELLISRRQINQYIKWVNQAPEEKNTPPEITIGWRGALFRDKL